MRTIHIKALMFVIPFFFVSLFSAFAALPTPIGFVTDEANILSSPVKTGLERMLSSFEQVSGIEIAVVTVASLEERPIEDYSVELFQKWGIGKKGKENGLLFLIAPHERRMRVEVGYGLEGVLNDARAGRIMDEEVLPFFREEKMEEGILSGTVTIVSLIAQAEKIPFDPQETLRTGGVHPSQRGIPLPWWLKLFIPLVLLYLFIRHPWLFLLLMSSGRGGGGFSSGGGGFGGFGGFGGGFSGGGGSSRGW